MKLIKVSSKGQFSIPKEDREKIKCEYFVYNLKGRHIVLTPAKIEPEDDLKDFGLLSESAFDFWNDPADDVYNKFYSEKKSN